MTTQKKISRDHYKRTRWQQFDDFSDFVDRLLDNDGITINMHHIEEEWGRKFEITAINVDEKITSKIESNRNIDMFPPHNVCRQIFVAFQIPHDTYNDTLLTEEDRARFDAFHFSVPVDVFFEQEGEYCKISWGFQNIKNVVGDYMAVDLSKTYTMDFGDIRPSDHRFKMDRPMRSLANALYKSIKRACYVATHLCSEYAMRSVTIAKKNNRDDFIKETIKKTHEDLPLIENGLGIHPYSSGFKYQAFNNIVVTVTDHHNEWSEERTEVELRLNCKAEDLQSVLSILKKLGRYNYHKNQ